MERFVLTPNEKFLIGTTLSAGVLTLRPTLSRRLLPVPSVVFAAVVAGVLISNSAGGSGAGALVALIVSVVLVGGASWLTLSFMRSQVTADASGLTVRDRGRKQSWSWDRIAGIGVSDASPGPVRASPAFLLTWRVWPGESTPVLYLKDRSIVRLWVLSSTSRSDMYSLGMATSAEIHAGLLARVHGLATGQASTYTPPLPST